MPSLSFSVPISGGALIGDGESVMKRGPPSSDGTVDGISEGRAFGVADGNIDGISEGWALGLSDGN